MEEFLEGLSKEDQIKYKRLSKELKGTDNIDKMKKYIPQLIILEERGKIEMEKKRKEQNH
ncbi:hypothetical protein [Oceanobacillus damuensis]|uniref:hypothetical protein n=1 Tax=Oceanobacillus damuensis TaxID=937928 RepID=UPI00082BA3E3|nr:hypothetical protein [Oceanobacillus damuensis]